MQKRGQLGIIEGKFAIIGFFAGLIVGLALVFLGSKKILPFQIPFVCGFFKKKKGQLIAIEFHFFVGGFVVGIIAALALVYLGTAGILPFSIPLVCPAGK
ncbi:hypothetical protein HOA91_02585 [Candidatus Woesearchaeota archaeon]|jgi:hypothetical protein|nr:hypothetical protein [Candidatus Woesearchaeota archaeon]